jgi:hypothetical protein
MEPRAFVDTLISVADRYNTSSADLKKLIQKICVASLKYICRRELYDLMFPEDYIHWELIEQHKENVFGGIVSWITMLDLMSWEELEKHEAEIRVEYPPLSLLRQHIRESSLDIPGHEGWTLACKIKLLSMIIAIPTLKAIDMLTCAVFKRNTTQQCLQLIALQTETMYTPHQQMQCIRYILQKATIQTKVVEQNLAISKALKEDTKLCLQMSRMQVVQGRPRLRDRLDQKARVENSFNTWESYTGFCYKHQFPPTLSEAIKYKLYFLACQTTWAWKTQLHKVLAGANTLLAKVAEFPITQPDLPIIIKLIESLSMDGRPPFHLLNKFRKECFQSFPMTHVEKMTLTQFLQLYICIYQPQQVWKDIWKHIIGVISVQIIRDCENFVQSNPLDMDEIMGILCG